MDRGFNWTPFLVFIAFFFPDSNEVIVLCGWALLGSLRQRWTRTELDRQAKSTDSSIPVLSTLGPEDKLVSLDVKSGAAVNIWSTTVGVGMY